MNQKEYEIIAAVINWAWQNDGIVGVIELAHKFADVLEANYPKTFDREKFLKSCELE